MNFTKKTVLIVLIILALGVGSFIGYSTGHSSGYSARDSEQRFKSYEDLITEVKQKELLEINNLVTAKSSINKVDEGGLFKSKYVHYLLGNITNNAVATSVKDIKLKIDYLSATKSIISSEEVTVYSVISPNNTKSFKEKIMPPAKTESFNYSVINVGIN